ncbi:MAG: hypothetical protein DRP87_06625 [Spirochaetes bacterium]|nr:MAG: hypothetical protein DRP87_06625 [Spirochaetota bacterium]
MKGRKKTVLIISLIIFAGAGVFLTFGRQLLSVNKQEQDTQYNTVKVTRQTIRVTVPASGSFEPVSVTTVRPDSNMPSRKVEKIFVKIGQIVESGKVVAVVDSSGLDLELSSALSNLESQKAKMESLKEKPTKEELTIAKSELDQAKANLEIQESNYKSVKALHEKGLASRDQLLEAEKQLTLARANFETASLKLEDTLKGADSEELMSVQSALSKAENEYLKARLAFQSTRIRTPVSGKIAELHIKTGDLISPSSEIVTVTVNNPMILKASVDEIDIGKVKPGLKATVTPFGFPDLQLTGEVTEINPKAKIEGNVTVFEVSIEVPNANETILWGMNADAEIVISEARDVLALPNSAIQRTVRTSSGLPAGSTRAGGNLPGTGMQRPDGVPFARGGQRAGGGTLPEGVIPEGGESASMTDMPGREGTGNIDSAQGPESSESRTAPGNMANRAIVLVKSGDETTQKIVVTGITDGLYTQIISGLEEGDEVILPKNRSTAGTEGRGVNPGMMFRAFR